MDVECKVCGKIIAHKNNLPKHMRTHLIREYPCDSCNQICKGEKLLEQHIKRIHEKSIEKKHKCQFCDLKFYVKSQLTYHLRKHTGEKPYKCDICNDSFAFNTYLTSHVNQKHP